MICNKSFTFFSFFSKAFEITFCVHFFLFGFGKNKVQYENLKWHYYTTPHFTIYFHENQGILPNITAQWLENAYANLNRDFGHKQKKTIPLLIYSSPILFEQTNVTSSIIPENVGGFTESLKNRIVVPFTGAYDDYRHVLHHELVHAFQFGILFDKFGGSLLRMNAAQLPLWFAEGSAEYLSSGWTVDADMFLMDRVIYGNLPLPGPYMDGYIVYKGGQSFLHFLAKSRGDSTFHNFLATFRRTKRVTESLEKVYREKLLDLGKEWHREMKRIYWPEIGKREDLSRKGVALTSREKSRSYFNLNPRISPNGSMIAYYSDAKDYTKIFISDRKGKVLYKIGQYSYAGQFESFQPFRSGMCWGPEGNKIAFITKNKGKNEIRIVNIKTKKHILTFAPDLSSISSPHWSSDGKMLVYTGLKKNHLNIYLYNIEKDEQIQLTKDIRFESDPRFSPDGKHIIFASRDTCGIMDRRERNKLPFMNLYLLKIEDLSVTQLTDNPWNEKQPCFSPDGNSIAYISDRNGINNIYIAPLSVIDSARALTDIIGGCSNPDWSSRDNTIVFTLFQKGGWDVWYIEDPSNQLHDSIPSPTLWVQCQADTSLDFFLPGPIPEVDTIDLIDISQTAENDSSGLSEAPQSQPKEEDGGLVETISKKKRTNSTLTDTAKTAAPDSVLTIPSDSSIASDTLASQPKETAPDISIVQSLDMVVVENNNDTLTASDSVPLSETDSITETIVTVASQKTQDDYITPILTKNLKSYPYRLKFSVDMVSAGMAYSTLYGPGGQGILVLSDLMGNHQIALALNFQSSFEENSFFGSYYNSQYRIDFGLAAFYERYYTVLSMRSLSTSFEYDLYHDTNIGGNLLLRYPFSLFARLDLSLFYQHMARKPVTYNGDFHPNDSIPTMSVNITRPSLTYTFDNILWGITGPTNGLRASGTLLVSPPLQSSDPSYMALDFDIRKYWHINRRFILANKLAFGFSEPMGRDQTPREYFLGGNEYWLFYKLNRDNYIDQLLNSIYSSFVLPFRGWSYFDITGSRYAVLNTEFRFPFVQTIDIVWPLPMRIAYINGAFFIDVGNAWDPEDQYKGIPLPKKLYGGIGFGLRANLGIFILRYDLAWKTDWHRYVKDPINYFSLGAEF